MVKVEILDSLFNEIEKKFKGEAHKIIDLLESLKENPRRGKPLGNVGGILIKELKYKSFRFYFLVDAYRIKFFGLDQLEDLLIKFVRMNDKKSQQKVINEIKDFLRKI